MKIKSLIILIIIVAILIALKFVFIPNPNGASSPTAPTGALTNVSILVVKSEKLENIIYASGTIVANEEVELKPEIAGKIIQLPLKEGTLVEKGALLLKINDADFQAQLKKLQLEISLATTQLNRQQELLKINGISQEEVDVSQNKVNTLKADGEYLQSQIAKTEIRAPFNGMLGLKKISEGAYVNTSSSVATILQIDPLKIDFSISERYAQLIQKGIKVIFTIAGVRDSIMGEVYAIEPKIDLNTRTIQVRAICPNKGNKILPGAFANIRVLLTDSENAILIPTEAVIPEIRGKKVFVLKNGKAQPVMIEAGIRTSTKLQVIKGLQNGDTVITTGIMQLKPDAKVNIIN